MQPAVTTDKSLVQSNIPAQGFSYNAGIQWYLWHTTPCTGKPMCVDGHGHTWKYTYSQGMCCWAKEVPCPKTLCQVFLSNWDSFFDVNAWTKCLAFRRSFPDYEHQDVQNGAHIKENTSRKFAK